MTNVISVCLALWNGNDPILKERLYGLTNPQESVSITRIMDDQCNLCLFWSCGTGTILF